MKRSIDLLTVEVSDFRPISQFAGMFKPWPNGDKRQNRQDVLVKVALSPSSCGGLNWDQWEIVN